nr:formin-B-like [Quercus suber]
MGLEFDSFENGTKFKVQPLDGKSTPTPAAPPQPDSTQADPTPPPPPPTPPPPPFDPNVDKEGSIEYYFSNNNFEIQDHIWIEQLIFPTDRLFEEILRVLKPVGTILVHKNPQSTVGETDKITSALERKLLLAGFLEVGVLKSTVPSEVQSFGMNRKLKENFLTLKSKGEDAFKRKDYLGAICWYTEVNRDLYLF